MGGDERVDQQRDPSVGRKLDQICDQFESALKDGRTPHIESYLDRVAPDQQLNLLRELLHLELTYGLHRGEQPQAAEYAARFPQLGNDLANVLDEIRRPSEAAKASENSVFDTVKTSLGNSPAGIKAEESTDSPAPPAPDLSTFATIVYKAGDAAQDEHRNSRPLESDSSAESSSDPVAGEGHGNFPSCGRYQITKRLGAGAFGEVFQGVDSELGRSVAIKVPRVQVQSAINYQAEAKTLASLRHPGIIAIYDVGLTEDGRSYIVSEFVEGSDLEVRMRRERASYREAAALVANVADALHYAHVKGLIHRDVKPANILLDAAGQPRVADFGLALHENEQRSRAGEFCGTRAYMSPEQFRAESHRLDGRSDIWSLGVILYELLTGRRPFAGKTEEIRDEVLHREPKPPRMIDDSIPQELERITLKCLSKQITNRYSTALELSHDLRNWNQPKPSMSRRSVVLTAVVVVVVGVLGYLGAKPSNNDELPKVPSAGTIANRPESSSPGEFSASELVEQFRVIHFRDRENRSELTGEIGVDALQAHANDSVRVHAKFRRPVYCYLLAFNPNGQEQMCYPADETIAPVISSTLEYPQDTSEAFYLTDGAGQQAFAMIVSQTALPPYQKWRSQIGQPPWQHVDCDVVLRFGGKSVQVCKVDRGTVGKLKGVDVFEQLCHFLREKSTADVVQALAFPVLPTSK